MCYILLEIVHFFRTNDTPTLLKKVLFIYDLFLAVPGLRCCTGSSPVVVSGSYSVIAVHRLPCCGAQL